MHLIKVNAINSTNSFAREMFRDKPQMPVTCIVAKKQWEGRGQRGTHWETQEGKNLTFSVVLPLVQLAPARQFLLSAAVACSILCTLEKFSIPRLKVKWPNDILSANRKIAGILIENILSEGKLAASIIGIGINVNQDNFDGLPQASSLKLVCQNEFDLDELLLKLLQDLENSFNYISEENSDEILRKYHQSLFKYRMPSTFELPSGALFTGMILGVTPEGKLKVQEEDRPVKEFDLKEIKMRY